MQDLKIWEEKIKEKISKLSYRDFIKVLISWYPIILNKNNGIISKYPDSQRIKGICSFKDFDNLLEGKEINYYFSKNFFENYKDLFSIVDLPNLIHSGVENADFADTIFWSRNIYLSSAVVLNCENVLYSFHIKENSKNILNSLMAWENCENIYFSTGIIGGYNIFYSKYIFNSSEIWHSRNLVGCKECIFCENLENKTYYIKNVKYSQKEYFEKKKNILSFKNYFLNWYFHNHTKGVNFGSNNVSGNFIVKSENFDNGKLIYNVIGGKNGILNGSSKGAKDMFECFLGGSPSACGIYLTIGGDGENIFCSDLPSLSYKNYYCFFTENCSFCLGCIGLKNKSFCILNKQYTKEEWYELANKIFAQMEEDGILGDFFPGSLNPFYFNDTMAYLIDDSFTKEEVEKEGYMWREEKIKVDIPEGAEIVYSTPPTRSSLLPQFKGTQGVLSDYQGFDKNGNWKINPEILKKVIVDNDGNYYKIVPMEYDFLMKHALPLPEIHWLERIKMGFKI